MVFTISTSHKKTRLKFTPSLIENPPWYGGERLCFDDYSSLFEKLYSNNIYDLYKAPIIAGWLGRRKLKVNFDHSKVIKVPDILFFGDLFVSEKVKNFIEKNSNYKHQMVLTEIRDKNGVSLDVNYYKVFVRTLVLLKGNTIEVSKDLSDKKILLWREVDENNIVSSTEVYFSERFLNALSNDEWLLVKKYVEVKEIVS